MIWLLDAFVDDDTIESSDEPLKATAYTLENVVAIYNLNTSCH